MHYYLRLVSIFKILGLYFPVKININVKTTNTLFLKPFKEQNDI